MKHKIKETQVILVDENDHPTGISEKIEAHQKGLLHRAISVFIVNSKGEWLLQQRAMDKYHSGGLWTNACCSHPNPGESCELAAKRRLLEEMGLETELKELFSFTYRDAVGNNLIEYELDHVFIGKTDDIPDIDHREVHSWKYLPYSEIKKEVKTAPENFSLWFLKIMDRVKQALENKLN